MRGTLIVSLLLAVLAVVFALANPQLMEVNLLVGIIEGSTALVLILTFAAGVLVGILATLPSRYRQRRKRKALEKQRQTTTPGTAVPPPGEAPPFSDEPGSRSSGDRS